MKFLVKLRDQISKWIMRTKNAGVILRMPLLGVTAVSTLVTALKGTALDNYTIGIIAVFSLAAVVFIWAYDRFQVMNMQNRWNADRSSNFTSPTTAINQVINARQLSVLAQGINEGWTQDKIFEEMHNETVKGIKKYRNGIDMSDYE